MTTPAALIHLLSFITGAAGRGADRLPLLTGLPGLAGNLGGLATFGLLPVSHVREAWFFPLLVAAAFTALGFSPAAASTRRCHWWQ